MENYYLFIVIVLFALAISDLIVGVSNDAVNFLNSAIGSKVASFKVILVIAALGVLVGATFSSGMMEVARKGIFHPQYFNFHEIMIIFLAVMLTDIILLDLFNTFGMPTSTTVSIVFELLGSALAISTIKIATEVDAYSISEYINTSKALAIISAILFSVVIAFLAGVIIQFLVRLVFSFNYVKKLNYLGSIFGGLAITSITYFMLIKGLKGSVFAENIVFGELLKDFVKHQAFYIILVSFGGWTVILQLLRMLFKVNILKVVVFVGTFALAMAFAGNDLVNFIGVPLAGYESFTQFIGQTGKFLAPEDFMMAGLSAKVQTPIFFLVAAGLIMVLTLAISKKARSVVQTSVDLSRQDEGDEKFGASPVARGIISQSVKFAAFLQSILPPAFNRFLSKQFDQTESLKRNKKLGKEAPAFDMLRASVNLIVAAIVIAYATSYELPLSTTYVTFMVAMGTSLSDKAWGRESAVFRITGVLMVILGWFFTALVALTISFGVAYLLYYTGIFGIIIMLSILGVIVWRSSVAHKRKSKEKENDDIIVENVATIGVIESCEKEIVEYLTDFEYLFKGVLNSLFVADARQLRIYNKEINKLFKKAKKRKKSMHKPIHKIQDDLPEAGLYYVETLDYLREMAYAEVFASELMLEHLENQHQNISFQQIEELRKIKEDLSELILTIRQIVAERDYEKTDYAIKLSTDLSQLLSDYILRQVIRVKSDEGSNKASTLYFAIVHEIKNFNLHALNLLKSHRDFVNKR